MCLFPFSHQTRAAESFSFLEKARVYYKKEISSLPLEIRGNAAIDSLLTGTDHNKDFTHAFNTSWKIGLYLLEKGEHGDALDIFSDIRQYMNAKGLHSKEDKHKMSSLLNVIGAIYEESGLWNEALDLYMNSLRICEEIGFDEGKARVYNNIGKLYFGRNELDKAELLFNKAISINTKLKIKPELFTNYNNLAGIYKLRHNPKKALEYALIAMNQLDISKDLYNLSIVYLNLGNIYQDLGTYSLALTYYQQAAEIQQKKSYMINLLRAYLNMGSLYENMNNMDSANSCFARTLQLAEVIGNPTQELEALLAAAKYYKRHGDTKKSNECFSRYVTLNDSLVSLNSLTKMEQIQAVYEVINKEKDNKILQQKINLQQLAIERVRIFLGGVTIIAVLLLLYLFNLRRNRQRERSKNELIAKQTELLHQKEKEMLLSKEQRLTQEIDYKNRQLTSYVLHLSRNNEFISKLSQELKQMLLTINPREKEKSEKIRNILSEMQQYSTGPNWEQFRLYFEEVHQSFEKNLTTAFPDLSPNDKKICALLKLGLSTKDIASITFRELRSVESARNRLRKKMGLAPDVNLYTYLSQF
ncbi:MAG: tetratricopeptide repeat protein [Bacteroidota bacterium]|nr:tetratricopeptide repeat protein [Bacteroidota bacterium]